MLHYFYNPLVLPNCCMLIVCLHVWLENVVFRRVGLELRKQIRGQSFYTIGSHPRR